MWKLLGVLSLTAAIACAQSSATSVVGRITDPTGAVIASVAVTVTNLDTNLSRQTVASAISKPKTGRL